MMLAHPQLDTVFDFGLQKVNTLIIENPRFFMDFLRDIGEQIGGCCGKAVLSQKNTPIDFSKNAEIIDSFISFEISRKTLINKIVSRMEETAVSESNFVRNTELMRELESYVLDLSFDLPCEIFCSKMNIGAVLRSLGIEIADNYDNDLERLLDYMELSRELDREKLFILVNLRSYYPDSEISEFFSSVIDHEFNVLAVESFSRKFLENEARLTVDSDLCEF